MKLGAQPLALGQDTAAQPPAQPPQPPAEQQAPAQAADQSLAVREVLSFPLRLIPGLPAPSTLVCTSLSDSGGWRGSYIVFTTSGEVRQRCDELALPCFIGTELQVLAVGAEQDRVWPPDIKRWCQRKLDEPVFDVTVGEVFAGVKEKIRPQGWTVAQVLERIGLRLLKVGVGPDEGRDILSAGGAP